MVCIQRKQWNEAGEYTDMKEMKWWMDIVKNLTMLTQFSFTLVTPLLMCLGICWLLCAKVGLGGWIYIPGFFFGMGGSATVAYKFYLSVNKQEKKKHKKNKIYFNRHS